MSRRTGGLPHVRHDHFDRATLLEDIADLLEAEPTMTLEGLALRLGRKRDSLYRALRRAALDGNTQADALRRRLHEIRKDDAA